MEIGQEPALPVGAPHRLIVVELSTHGRCNERRRPLAKPLFSLGGKSIYSSLARMGMRKRNLGELAFLQRVHSRPAPLLSVDMIELPSIPLSRIYSSSLRRLSTSARARLSITQVTVCNGNGGDTAQTNPLMPLCTCTRFTQLFAQNPHIASLGPRRLPRTYPSHPIHPMAPSPWLRRKRICSHTTQPIAGLALSFSRFHPKRHVCVCMSD